MSLFFSLDLLRYQNYKLFKVPIEQWGFSLCFYLENKPNKNFLMLQER